MSSSSGDKKGGKKEPKPWNRDDWDYGDNGSGKPVTFKKGSNGPAHPHPPSGWKAVLKFLATPYGFGMLAIVFLWVYFHPDDFKSLGSKIEAVILLIGLTVLLLVVSVWVICWICGVTIADIKKRVGIGGKDH